VAVRAMIGQAVDWQNSKTWPNAGLKENKIKIYYQHIKG